MSLPSLGARLLDSAKAWGPASFSYWSLSVAQVCAGVAIDGAIGALLGLLGVFGIVLGLAHKGQTFDQVRAKSKSSLPKLPWSQKTIHVIVCLATMSICAQSLSSETTDLEILGYAGTIAAAVAGWLATLVDGPASKAAD